MVGDAGARIDADRRAGRRPCGSPGLRLIAAPVADVRLVGPDRDDRVRRHADRDRLLEFSRSHVEDVDRVGPGRRHEQLAVEDRQPGRVRLAALFGVHGDDRDAGQRERLVPLIMAVVPAASDEDIPVGRGGINQTVVNCHADHAEPWPVPPPARRRQRLLDLPASNIDEQQLPHALDDERLAAVEGRQGHGPAGEGHLPAGRLENLVGRNDDPPVGLHADFQAVLFVGWSGIEG